ncbi:CobW family GTP-binding protein [Teredinibacter purpureus]|uniref:CobW family GTP-binding protein n=1 Tax=Teredinibacter purpureus TaxID=2731756 RepID=UPI0005F7968B|nr:GTP-binding protein [Teredinibacter purpureus]
MASQKHNLSAVPTNIITGFLGVGKTTAILHLLKSKPESERWAVLVNEFGEIGVDGSLFQGQHAEVNGVFIREVPGGCMCCASGLPMQIALNQLLTRAKPNRLLIEPTGLGHPKEVLEVLSASHYHDVLHIQKCITLIDARKLHDTRYTEHNTFNQQIDIADVIVGNKQDLYQAGDQTLLNNYVADRKHPEMSVIFSRHGQIDPSILKGSSETAKAINLHHHHNHQSPRPSSNNTPLPEDGFLKIENSGEGYQSTGWRFSPDKIFDRQLLFCCLSGIRAERIKAVFITHEGVFAYNATADALTEFELDDCIESRIEIIARNGESINEIDLLQCVVK